MNKNNVTTPEDIACYMLDCTLATVVHLAMIKSKSKNEFKRQKKIAQECLDWLLTLDIYPSNTRGEDVIKDHDGSVESYAKAIEQKYIN